MIKITVFLKYTFLDQAVFHHFIEDKFAVSETLYNYIESLKVELETQLVVTLCFSVTRTELVGCV